MPPNDIALRRAAKSTIPILCSRGSIIGACRLALRCGGWILFLVIGCERVPSKAPAKERAAIRALQPMIENVQWSESAHVRALHLSGDEVMDSALVHVSHLNEIEELNLNGGRITNDGLAHLQDLRKLRALSLQWTAITDSGLEHVPTEHLTTFALSHTRVSDAGIGSIQNMHKLEQLFIEDTLITESGVSRIKKALPRCRIQWSDQTTGEVSD